MRVLEAGPFLKILDFGIKFEGRRFRSCPILPRVLRETVPRSSTSFFRSQSLPAQRFGPIFMLRWMQDMSMKRHSAPSRIRPKESDDWSALSERLFKKEGTPY